MEQHTYEYRLHKVVVLAECIRDLVGTIDSERDEKLRESLLYYASMINNTAEQMLCNSRATEEIQKAIDKADCNAYNGFRVKVLSKLPPEGEYGVIYIVDGRNYIFDDHFGFKDIDYSPKNSVFDFIRKFDSENYQRATVYTEMCGEITIDKFSMFPENSYSVNIGNGYGGTFNKLQLAEFLGSIGFKNYQFIRVEPR